MKRKRLLAVGVLTVINQLFGIMSSMKRNLLLAVAAAMFIRLVLMAVLPLTDPTEGRYANTGSEMVLRGDWVTPHVWLEEGLVPFLGKPPLHFWAEALCVKGLGVNELAVRLPAWVSACALLVILWLVLERVKNRKIAVTAVVIAATTGLFWVLSGAVATDMTLAATASGAVLCYMAFVSSEEKKSRTLLSLAVFFLLALAFLTKGPVALILFGLPVFLWTLVANRWDTLRYHAWLCGSLMFLLLTVPWFVLCEMRNPGFLHYFFVNENFLRFITPQYGDLYGHGHIYPRGSAIAMFLLGALPWSLMLPFLLWRKDWKAYFRGMLMDPVAGMAFIGVLSITFFWCFARQLLVTYLLPAIPLLAVWMATQLYSRKTIAAFAWPTVACLLVGSLIAIPMIGREKSLRYALRKGVQEKELYDCRFRFVRKTPYSAFFYARNRVIPHPRESVVQSLKAAQAAGPDVFLVFKAKYFSRVAPEDCTQMEKVLDTGEWIITRWMPVEVGDKNSVNTTFPRSENQLTLLPYE